ncbi:MAG: recombinase family protein, partial [Betaproteobacteria bacterium HGW-Betaproteobacteria-21]
MRTAAYCRFSSDAQRETSIRDQLRNIEAYCLRVGWLAPALYQDQAISGSRTDRPGYQAMLEAAELGAFDVLLVDDLSRLSRDHIESAQAVRRLKFSGIRIIGVSDGTDTSRDGYKLETGLRGLMSEWYLDDLAKKTHRGLMGQALEGYSAGGLPYGYRSEFDGNGHRRLIDEEQARWVHFVFERYAAGASPRQLAD